MREQLKQSEQSANACVIEVVLLEFLYKVTFGEDETVDERFLI